MNQTTGYNTLHQEPISPSIYEVINTTHLGALQEEFRVGQKWTNIVMGCLCLGAGVYAIISTFSHSYTGPGGPLVFLPAVLVGLFMAYYFFFYPQYYRSFRVYLCTGGFIYTHAKRIDVFRWEQIKDARGKTTRYYYRGFHTRTIHRYVIVGYNGRKIRLDEKFRHIERLGNTIIQAYLRGKRA
jgi:hypothetical protein